MTFKVFLLLLLIFTFLCKKIFPFIDLICYFFYFMTLFAEIGFFQDKRFVRIKHKASSCFSLCRIWLVSKRVQQLLDKKIHNNSIFVLYHAKRFYG